MTGTITRLVGVTVRDAQENIRKFGHRDVKWYGLVREPDNLHDRNAVRVVFSGLYMGYIPRGLAARLAPLLDSGREFMAKFVRRRESPFHQTVGLEVEIVEEPQARSAKNSVRWVL